MFVIMSIGVDKVRVGVLMKGEIRRDVVRVVLWEVLRSEGVVVVRGVWR